MEDQVLRCYQAMSEASGRMLAAAESADWDALTQAESECASQVERLKDLGDGSPLSTQGNRVKMMLIRKMLAEDARIRELTQPWLRTLENLLRGGASERKLKLTYG